MEMVVLAALALYGIGCTAALVAVLAHRGNAPDPPPFAPEKLEPPDRRGPETERHPAREVFAVMADLFPAEYARYRVGALGYRERRRVWDACCAIHDARAEIEAICAPSGPRTPP